MKYSIGTAYCQVPKKYFEESERPNAIEYSIRSSLAREMASRRQRVYYKDASSSGSDMTLEIDNTTHISSNTSRWTKEDCIALKILYVDASNISEIIITPQLDNHYKQLELKGWGKQTFYLTSDSDNPSRKIATIMRKVANVLRNEQEDHRKVNSFVMSLLDLMMIRFLCIRNMIIQRLSAMITK